MHTLNPGIEQIQLAQMSRKNTSRKEIQTELSTKLSKVELILCMKFNLLLTNTYESHSNIRTYRLQQTKKLSVSIIILIG